jgi:hypothetical protein
MAVRSGRLCTLRVCSCLGRRELTPLRTPIQLRRRLRARRDTVARLRDLLDCGPLTCEAQCMTSRAVVGICSTLVMLFVVALGAIDGLVWMPLALAPDYTLTEIHAAMDAVGEGSGSVGLIVAWAVLLGACGVGAHGARSSPAHQARPRERATGGACSPTNRCRGDIFPVVGGVLDGDERFGYATAVRGRAISFLAVVCRCRFKYARCCGRASRRAAVKP